MLQVNVICHTSCLTFLEFILVYGLGLVYGNLVIDFTRFIANQVYYLLKFLLYVIFAL